LLLIGTASRSPASFIFAKRIRFFMSDAFRGGHLLNYLDVSIWKAYLGLRDCRERTGKAHEAEVKRYRNAAKRAGKEVGRAALRRKPKSQDEAHELSAAKLKIRIEWLQRGARTKLAQAQSLMKAAKALNAEAALLEALIHGVS
jgi:hypothetical protein